MTVPATLAKRLAYVIFGLLALVELLVVLMVGRPAALILLGLLLPIQLLMIYAFHCFSCLSKRYALLKRTYERELASNRRNLDGLEQAVTFVNSEGQISYVNDTCQEMLGYSAQEIVGKHPSDFTAYDDAVLTDLPIPAVGEHRTSLRRSDGRPLSVTISGRPYWHQGHLLGNLATIVPFEPSLRSELN